MGRKKKEQGGAAETASPKNGKGRKKDPQTLQTMSDDQRQALFYDHLKKVRPLITAVKAAQEELSAAFSLAKGELGKTAKKELLDAIAMDTLEGELAIRDNIERQLRVARYIGAGIGTQFDFFGGATPPLSKAYEEGKRAGLQGETCRPPPHLSQDDAQRWISGHNHGQGVLAQGFRPKTPIEQSAEIVPIGDAPSSHRVVQ